MILITGASGLIGRALVKTLRASGKKLRLHVRNGKARDLLAGLVDESTEVIEQELAGADSNDMRRLVEGCSSIIHTAAVVHNLNAPPEMFAQINEAATRALSEEASSAGVETFVFLSTSAVYGNGPFVNIDESAPLNPQTPYADSKAASERWLGEQKPVPRIVVLRPSLVFGEGDRGNMLSLIRQIDSGRYFHIGGNSACKSVIYSGDAARCIESILDPAAVAQAVCASNTGDYLYGHPLIPIEQALPGVRADNTADYRSCAPAVETFNLALPGAPTVVELANDIAACLKHPKPPTVPSWVLEAGARLAESWLAERAPLTRARLDKLTTTTTLAVTRLQAAIACELSLGIGHGIRAEIDWARQVGAL